MGGQVHQAINIRPLFEMTVHRDIALGFILLVMLKLTSYAQVLTPGHSEAGIDHVYTQRLFNGGGVVFFDSDNDGDDDLYITGGEDVDHFYLNNGDGLFEYYTPFAGFNITTDIYTTAAYAGDFNGDRLNDLFVTTIFDRNFNFYKNLLFINQGDNTFREVWDHTSPLDEAWTMGATLFDFDLDGDLDIYTINYIRESNLVRNEMDEVIGYAHTCYPNRMYENLGNLQFREISSRVGLNDVGCGLAVVATDYDLDGDQDIYLANDFGPFVTPNKMFRNDYTTEGSFFEESERLRTDLSFYGMGIAVGDVNNDNRDDLYITNFGRNALLVYDDSVYTDRTTEAGVENILNVGDTTLAVSWGANFLDVDNDGDLDLYVANGYAPTSAILPSDFGDSDQLYFNDGTGKFILDTTAHPASNVFASRGTAYSDIDDDGDLDIFTVVFDRPSLGLEPISVLYVNQNDSNHWLKVSLEGVQSNFNAFGARVRIYAGGDILERELLGGSSHCSQNSGRVHFGLGQRVNIDSMAVFWPGHSEPQWVRDIPADQTIYIREDTTGRVVTSVIEAEEAGLKIFPNPAASVLWLNFEKSLSGTKIPFTIYDPSGKVRLRGVFPNQPGIQIDISSLPSGVYILSIQDGRKRYSVPFSRFH